MNGRAIRTVGLASAALALGMLLNFPSSAAQSAGAERPQAERPALPPTAGTETTPEATLVKTERMDVDDDGTVDIVGYYDMDGDGVVDAEVIDLGATGKADILAIRCDADGDGREDDWAVVDAATEQIRAALIDGNDDGETELVSYGEGIVEALPDLESPVIRVTNTN